MRQMKMLEVFLSFFRYFHTFTFFYIMWSENDFPDLCSFLSSPSPTFGNFEEMEKEGKLITKSDKRTFTSPRINNSLFTDCLDIRSFYNEESRPEGWSEKKKGDSKDGFCRAIEIFFMLEEEMKSFLFVSVQLFCLLPFRKKTFSTKSASEWSALPFKAFESLHNSWMDSRKTFYLSFRMGLRDESKRVFTARRTCYQCDGWEWCGKFPFRQSLLMLLLRLWMERKRKMFLVVHA